VGEHHRRPAEYIVFENHTGVEGHVVLNLHVVADDDVGGHDDVLADVAAPADARTVHDVGEVPDLRVVADLAALIDEAGFVRGEFHTPALTFGCRCDGTVPAGDWRMRCVSSIDGRLWSMPKPWPASTS